MTSSGLAHDGTVDKETKSFDKKNKFLLTYSELERYGAERLMAVFLLEEKTLSPVTRPLRYQIFRLI